MFVEEFLEKYPLITRDIVSENTLRTLWNGKKLIIGTESSGLKRERADYLFIHEVMHFIEIEPINRIFKFNLGMPLIRPSKSFKNAIKRKYSLVIPFREARVGGLETLNQIQIASNLDFYVDPHYLDAKLNTFNFELSKEDMMYIRWSFKCPTYNNQENSDIEIQKYQQRKMRLKKHALEYAASINFWDRFHERYELLEKSISN